MINVLYVVTSCKKVGPTQQLLNLIMNLDREIFTPYLMTLYKESDDGTSQLEKFKPYIAEHIYVSMDKLKILVGTTRKIKNAIMGIKPDIIHSAGVFPDYLISRIGFANHVTTLRNCMFDDYIAKFGVLRGMVLSCLQLVAIYRMKRVWVCSKSLSDIYKRKLGRVFPFIQNGINTDFYYSAGDINQNEVRRRLNLPVDKLIYVYSGQIGKRKNQSYLADIFSGVTELKDRLVVFLGKGPMLGIWKDKYAASDNVMFLGEVNDVRDYLIAADVYVSSSLSEGLPNGVLEAMAIGKAVVLSDIPQHQEVLCGDNRIGRLFSLDGKEQCIEAILDIDQNTAKEMGKNARACVEKFFSAKVMSKKYQKEYILLTKGR